MLPVIPSKIYGQHPPLFQTDPLPNFTLYSSQLHLLEKRLFGGADESYSSVKISHVSGRS